MTTLRSTSNQLLMASVLFMSINFSATRAEAHGGLGHIQVTAWAAENLPEGELRTFLANEHVFNSLLFGAAYPDIGYYPGLKYPELARQFAEYSHWPPFIESFAQWVRENDPPPWRTLESRKRIAFLLGCAAHGYQDEVFDSLFLDQVGHHDGQGQSEADPASDGFLVMDLLLATVPDGDIPVDALISLYNASGVFDEEIVEDHLLSSMKTMTDLYIDEDAGPLLATVATNGLLDDLIWTRDNYMNPDIPGSLHSEIYPTMFYMEGLWKRMHGDYSDSDVVMFSFPESSRRLRSHDASAPDSWVSYLFSSGIAQEELTATWKDSSGDEVGFDQRSHAWGGNWTRLMRLKPTENLVPGGYYTSTISGTVSGVGDKSWSIDHNIEFQVNCRDDNMDLCGDTPVLEPAKLDGAEAFRAEWVEFVEDASDSADDLDETSGCSASNRAPLELLLLVFTVYLLRRKQRLLD
ncbi:MAG: zinc dependent phospholipase C family protein [Deltaproteobacteria bacterium]|jgi:hypothetical protein|nr:zinc dependent phospholipase C family protein [Deltaproteobacteria bacterium]MBT6434996.1 zinc dependent phospholipase C family protein [Deltaproteobacteria bacterium]MBT6491101.1 zinc dependent phospholipase C family protein [Deltaproteobacteria bacterium]